VAKSERASPVSGKIFPEYWINCRVCDVIRYTGEHHPAAAARWASGRGWVRRRGAWTCPICYAEGT
jgi:hypothetical protein